MLRHAQRYSDAGQPLGNNLASETPQNQNKTRRLIEAPGVACWLWEPDATCTERFYAEILAACLYQTQHFPGHLVGHLGLLDSSRFVESC